MNGWTSHLPAQLKSIFPPTVGVHAGSGTRSEAVYEYKVLFAPSLGAELRCTLLVRVMGLDGRMLPVERYNFVRDVCAYTAQRFDSLQTGERSVRFQGSNAMLQLSTRFRCASWPRCASSLLVRDWKPLGVRDVAPRPRSRVCCQCGQTGHNQSTCCESPGVCRIELVWYHDHASNRTDNAYRRDRPNDTAPVMSPTVVGSPTMATAPLPPGNAVSTPGVSPTMPASHVRPPIMTIKPFIPATTVPTPVLNATMPTSLVSPSVLATKPFIPATAVSTPAVSPKPAPRPFASVPITGMQTSVPPQRMDLANDMEIDLDADTPTPCAVSTDMRIDFGDALKSISQRVSLRDASVPQLTKPEEKYIENKFADLLQDIYPGLPSDDAMKLYYDLADPLSG